VARDPYQYSSETIGITLTLPEGWSKTKESAAEATKAAQVVFSKNDSMCAFLVARYHLQISEDNFNKMIESSLTKSDDVRKLSQASVVRDGLAGTRSVINYKLKDVEWHTTVELFTSGDTHYALVAAAPLDDYQRYAAEVDKLLDSVRFPGLHVDLNDLKPKSP
jgi:hypothetical protein